MQKNSDQLEILTQTSSQSSTSSLSDFLVKIYLLLVSEVDYKLTEAAYFLKQCESLGLRNPNILSLKMSKGCFPVTKDRTSTSYCEQLPSLGMMVNGNYVIQGGFSPKTESEYTLSDILEENPSQEYFLSKERIKIMLGC